MSNVLEVSAIKLGAPVTLVVGIESYDLAFHKLSEEPLCSNHDQQHFELGSRSHRVRLISRQDDGFTLPQLETVARDLDVSLAIGDYHQRIERRCMFAEAFAYVECEHCNRAALVLQQHAANDGAILILQ